MEVVMDTATIVTTICTVLGTAITLLLPTFWFISRLITGSDHDKRLFAVQIGELTKAISSINEKLATLIPRVEHDDDMDELHNEVSNVKERLVAVETTQRLKKVQL
jgi:hypothetical protein